MALLLSQFAPFLLTPILMIGGTYLCYEGAEKIWEKFSGHEAKAQDPDEMAAADAAAHEKQVVSSAIRTDFILSAEIMVIALNEVADEPLVARAIILLVVAVLITALVYGVVGLIVKMDDAGLRSPSVRARPSPASGAGWSRPCPIVLSTLSWVGMVAMLWVGGHILLVGADELGLHAPYDLVHHLEVAVHDATGGLGPALGWLTNTFFSAVLGVIVGALVVAVLHLLPKRRRIRRARRCEAASHHEAPEATDSERSGRAVAGRRSRIVRVMGMRVRRVRTTSGLVDNVPAVVPTRRRLSGAGDVLSALSEWRDRRPRSRGCRGSRSPFGHDPLRR